MFHADDVNLFGDLILMMCWSVSVNVLEGVEYFHMRFIHFDLFEGKNYILMYLTKQ
jgi:hypothetical protein